MLTRACLRARGPAANILINSAGQLRIGDFGLARVFDPLRQARYTQTVCTVRQLRPASPPPAPFPFPFLSCHFLLPSLTRAMQRWYRAPEILLGVEAYTEKIDVWAAGVILGEMFSKEPFLRVGSAGWAAAPAAGLAGGLTGRCLRLQSGNKGSNAENDAEQLSLIYQARAAARARVHVGCAVRLTGAGAAVRHTGRDDVARLC